MRTTGREVIDVLEKLIELEWFRYSRSEAGGNMPYVPITVWRFKLAEENKEIAEDIVRGFRSVLAKWSGNFPWTLKFSGRNWVLLPTQVQTLEDSGKFKTDGELLDYLYREQFDFGEKAHQDLAVIADELARSFEVRG